MISVFNSQRFPSGFTDQLGALFTWKPAPSGKTTILARVGVSLISSAQACANAEAEIPDFDFERVRAEARRQWNELLGRVQVDVTGVDKETVQLFYSSVSPSEWRKTVSLNVGLSFIGPIFLQQIVRLVPFFYISSHIMTSLNRHRRESQMELYRTVLRFALL